MNKVITPTKLLAISAVIFVTAALVSLPYQNQVANAAPAKRYQIIVTLTDVPAGAEDLEVNATIFGPGYIAAQEKIVSSPSEGDVVSFVFRVPSVNTVDRVSVCGNSHPEDFTLSSCEPSLSLPNQGSKPIRVDYSYPT
jgi:hypothetical protein